MAGASEGVHDFSSTHNWDHEHNGDDFKHHVDEGEEECDGADVLEGLPGCGVLHGFARPDVPHDKDPKAIHNDRHHT